MPDLRQSIFLLVVGAFVFCWGCRIIRNSVVEDIGLLFCFFGFFACIPAFVLFWSWL